MKRLLLLFSISISILKLEAQVIPKSIAERITYSDYIFEGKVIRSDSYETQDEGMIYTSSTIEIYKIFKGDLRCGTIEVTTEGGRVGDKSLIITHNLTLKEGMKGVFLCNETQKEQSTVDFFPETNTLKLDFPYDLQGFIKYFEDQFNIRIQDYSEFQLDSLARVYDLIELYAQIHYIDCQPDAEIISSTRFPANATSSVDTTLTFTMMNPQITGTSPYYLEFDIGVSDNQANIYFMGGTFRVHYDTLTFVPNIDGAGKVWVSRCPLIADPLTYKDPIVQISNRNEINIGFTWKLSWQSTVNYIDIPSTPTPAVHVKMEIDNCSHPSLVENVLGVGISGYNSFALHPVNPPTPYGQYLVQYSNPINFGGCNGIQIFSISPPTVAAGVGDVVTVTGSNFGGSQGVGNIFLKETLTGGAFDLELDANDILSWSNNEIRFVMPGVIDTSYGNVPGTGPLTVRTNSGTIATGHINVSYSLSTSVDTSSDIKYVNTPIDLSVNQMGGISFHLDTSITNHPDRTIVINKAVKDWVCLANIHFEIGAPLIEPTLMADDDTISMIQFGILPHGTLAKTYIHSKDRGCVDYLYKRPDIIFNLEYKDSMFCDTSKCDSLPYRYNDFYAIALHELGHAHGLEHVNDTRAIMYYAMFTGRNPWTPSMDRQIWLRLDASARAGANKVMSNSQQPVLTSCSGGGLIQPIFLTDCGSFWRTSSPSNTQNSGCSLIGIDELNELIGGFKIYPNPATSNLTVEVSNVVDDLELNIIDVFGRHIEGPLKFNKAEGKVLLDIVDYSSGFYFVIFTTPFAKGEGAFFKN